MNSSTVSIFALRSMRSRIASDLVIFRLRAQRERSVERFRSSLIVMVGTVISEYYRGRALSRCQPSFLKKERTVCPSFLSINGPHCVFALCDYRTSFVHGMKRRSRCRRTHSATSADRPYHCFVPRHQPARSKARSEVPILHALSQQILGPRQTPFDASSRSDLRSKICPIDENSRCDRGFLPNRLLNSAAH